MTLEQLLQLRPALVGALAKTLGHEDAESVTGDVLLTIALRIEAGSSTTAAFVWNLARWRATDALRHRGAEHIATEAAVPDRGVPDVYDDGGLEETRHLLDGLTDKQAAAIERTADGFSNAEIGAEMVPPISAGAVAHLLHRARATILRGPVKTVPRVARVGLSVRETEVLQKMADGMSVILIGVALRISPQTAKHHVQALSAKLGTHNAAGSVAEGFRSRPPLINGDAHPPPPDGPAGGPTGATP